MTYIVYLERNEYQQLHYITFECIRIQCLNEKIQSEVKIRETNVYTNHYNAIFA